MKAKIIAALPFAVTVYLAGALGIACYPPWVAGTAESPRYFQGFAPLWDRKVGSMTNGSADWSSLVLELLAWMLAIAFFLMLSVCITDFGPRFKAYFVTKPPSNRRSY